MVKKFTFKQIMGFVLTHSLIFGLIYIGIMLFIYYSILGLRLANPDGYFGSPFLSMISELTWFSLGVGFVLVTMGIRGYIKSK